jgi:hypothetical protein
MTPRSVAAIALKCLGLYFIVSAISTLGFAITGTAADGDSLDVTDNFHVFWWTAVPALIYLAAGLASLTGTEKILGLFFRDLGSEGDPSDLSPEGLQAIGFSLIGAWFFIKTAPFLISRLAVDAIVDSNIPEYLQEDWGVEQWSEVISLGLQTALGLALFFGARGLSSIWHRLRPLKQQPIVSKD